MLRFYTDPASTEITIEQGREPPRPVLEFPMRLQVAARETAVTDQIIEDFGQRSWTAVRLFSTESQGFMTWAEILELRTRYNAGLAFKVDTDLLLPPGVAAISYDARFAPGTTPFFTLAATEDLGSWAVLGEGSYYRFDLVLWMIPE
jgi:hypothetical protein